MYLFSGGIIEILKLINLSMQNGMLKCASISNMGRYRVQAAIVPRVNTNGVTHLNQLNEKPVLSNAVCQKYQRDFTYYN